jgi:hypothetical protein
MAVTPFRLRRPLAAAEQSLGRRRHPLSMRSPPSTKVTSMKALKLLAAASAASLALLTISPPAKRRRLRGAAVQRGSFQGAPPSRAARSAARPPGAVALSMARRAPAPRVHARHSRPGALVGSRRLARWLVGPPAGGLVDDLVGSWRVARVWWGPGVWPGSWAGYWRVGGFLGGTGCVWLAPGGDSGVWVRRLAGHGRRACAGLCRTQSAGRAACAGVVVLVCRGEGLLPVRQGVPGRLAARAAATVPPPRNSEGAP